MPPLRPQAGALRLPVTEAWLEADIRASLSVQLHLVGTLQLMLDG